jgi:polyadenylate-binding protein
MLLNDKKVFVGKFISRKDRLRDFGHDQRYTNVYVKNFGDDFTDEQLFTMFGQYGKIMSAKVMVDHVTGRSRGFGFVSYADHEPAMKAVDELNGTNVNGHVLYCGRAQKRKERQAELQRRFEAEKMERYSKYQGVNLYVKNLEDEVDDERLRKEFSKFGNITSAKVMSDEVGVSKGFGFVCFSSPEEATKAVTEMNGRIIVSKPLYVALAQRKEERQAHLANLRLQRMARTGMPPNQIQMFPQMYIAQPPGQRAFYPQTFAATRPWHQNQMTGVRPFYGGGPSRNRPMGPRGGMNMGTRVNTPRMPNQRMGQQQMGGQRGMKFTPSARNPPVPPPQAQVPPSQQEVPADSHPSQQLLASLTQSTPQQQKQIIGEHLYREIYAMHSDLAGKITGMLLEMDNSELLHMLEVPESLKSKVEEAVTVLRDHQIKEQEQQVAGSANIPSVPLAPIEA